MKVSQNTFTKIMPEGIDLQSLSPEQLREFISQLAQTVQNQDQRISDLEREQHRSLRGDGEKGPPEYFYNLHGSLEDLD